LFFAATVNYVDRQVLGLLKPLLQTQLGWNDIGYSNIVLAFQIAYAIGLLCMGRLMDWLGARRGFSLSVLIWSLAAMAHAAANSLLQFGVARFVLGLGESGNFPASIKTVAEWFPDRERALATGIFNSGTNIGAIVTPLVIPWITYRFGWRMAFIATGALGLIWLVFWRLLYHSPRELQLAAAAKVEKESPDPSEPKATRPPLSSALRSRQAWAIAAGRFFTDPVWYIYLFWAPDFLSRTHHLDLRQMALPLFVIYSGASLGSLAGGWLSSFLLKRTWSVNKSRKTALLVCALAVVPLSYAATGASLWVAVGLVALAAGAHQGWSANMYTLASDMFPPAAVATVVGFSSMVGAIGGMFAAKAVGYILQWTGSYLPVFAMASIAYLVAFAAIQLLAPVIRRSELVSMQAS
jgi:ACS family hexuronate transporter-like MFS transporter